MIRSWISRQAISHTYRRLGRGDPSAALVAFASNGRFRFAGDHSWTLDTTDAAQRRAWFERFASLRPHMTVRDVIAAGPPWRMRVAVVFDDQIRGRDGRVVYENHGIQYVQLRWGRITLDEVILDTQKIAEFDTLALA